MAKLRQHRFSDCSLSHFKNIAPSVAKRINFLFSIILDLIFSAVSLFVQERISSSNQSRYTLTPKFLNKSITLF